MCFLTIKLTSCESAIRYFFIFVCCAFAQIDWFVSQLPKYPSFDVFTPTLLTHYLNLKEE